MFFRPRACSITALVNWICNMIIGAIYPHISKAIGGLSFLIFGAIILISIVFVYFCVPETRGKTITEVQEYFDDKNSFETSSTKSEINSSRGSITIDSKTEP